MSDFIGIPRYKVPLRENELSVDNILNALQSLLPTYEYYALQIREDYNTYKGQQDILKKKRIYDDDGNINNIVVEPHLWAMVNFKCGYLFGNPVELANKTSGKENQVTYLNKYVNNSAVNLKGLISSVAEWVYATGVGYTFTEPKKSINIDYDAPFRSYRLDSDKAFKVYSSYQGNDPLFDVVITYVDEYYNQLTTTKKIIISVYTRDNYYEFNCDSFGGNITYIPERSARRGYKRLPITEFRAYTDGIGIVRNGKTLNDALNNITSASLDNIQELANEMLILINTLLGKTPEEKAQNLRLAKKNGIMEIFDNSKDIKADVKTITTKLEQSDINIRYQTIKDTLYGAWGVPLTSNRISSGNVTRGGVQSSGGWDFAYTIASRELNNLIPSIQELIEHFLTIGNEMPNSRIKDLNIGDLDVKVNISRSDNLMVKTQSYSYLVDRGVPADIALAICELVADPNTIGALIEKNRERLAKQNAEIQNKVVSQPSLDKGGNPNYDNDI